MYIIGVFFMLIILLYVYMPSKNIIRNYTSGGIYHIYNRGINKGRIFFDNVDYKTFIRYLSTYLLAKDTDALDNILLDENADYRDKNLAVRELRMNNFHGRLELCAYCLMSNHFHLVFKQHDATAIQEFMQSFITRFTMYVNKRHKRIGTLFQGTYKAAEVGRNDQLIYLTRYIHRNPMFSDGTLHVDLRSSYEDYLGRVKREWIYPQLVLDAFDEMYGGSYRRFVEDNDSELEAASKLLLKTLL